MSDMKTAGIVAEFNPFHNGHAMLIQKTRKAGFSHIAVVMSGNYTQRGEAACMLKSTRVQAALSGGADLVVELPLPWAVSSAERFAFGGVSLLSALGCVDAISFGSECGDMARLLDCAEQLRALDGSPKLAEHLQTGCSFPKARSLALGGEAAQLLASPNDTLAVEYLAALQKLGAPMSAIAIPRVGAPHDGAPQTADGIKTASASALRAMLGSETPPEALAYMPEAAAQLCKEELAARRAPFLPARAEPLMLAQLRRMDKEDLRRLPDVTEGLENRIFEASRTAGSLAELYRSIKTKRYTMARIRRILLYAYLGLDKMPSALPYLRVLGFNHRGLDLLRVAKQRTTLPITARHADFAQLDPGAREIYQLECRATDLYCLCLPQILPCGLEQKYKTVKTSPKMTGLSD